SRSYLHDLVTLINGTLSSSTQAPGSADAATTTGTAASSATTTTEPWNDFTAMKRALEGATAQIREYIRDAKMLDALRTALGQTGSTTDDPRIFFSLHLFHVQTQAV